MLIDDLAHKQCLTLARPPRNWRDPAHYDVGGSHVPAIHAQRDPYGSRDGRLSLTVAVDDMALWLTVARGRVPATALRSRFKERFDVHRAAGLSAEELASYWADMSGRYPIV